MTQKARIFSVAALYDGAGRLVEEADVHVVDGVVARVVSRKEDRGECDRLLRAHAESERVVVPNGLALPGLINSHHHAYSALARGMPVAGDLSDFPHVLENLWWRLDRALDLESIRLSGLVTAIECVRRGCTTIVDHHASPSCVGGSLDALAGAFDALSMTAELCFETSDRNGPAVFEESVAENLDFAARHRAHERLRGLFGLHAGFTLSRASLARLARDVPDDLPVHVHVAEDRCDVAHARAEGFAGPLDRLAKLGVLRRGSLLAHCVHLADEELALVDGADAFVIHNPESNFNNAVGYADLDRVPPARLLLGTDGMSSDMPGAARFAFLAYAGLGKGGRDPRALASRMLFDNPSTRLTARYGRPVGRILEGTPADLAIFDYRSPTPVDGGNFAGHLLYGLAPAPLAAWVYANGVPVVENGAVRGVDEAATLEAAKVAAEALWKRVSEMKP